MNSKILFGVAGLVGLYYMTGGKRSEDELRQLIATKYNELGAFTRKYLATKRTRVGLDTAIQPMVLELIKLEEELKNLSAE